MRAKATLGDTETLIRRNLEGGHPEHLLYRVGRARSVLDAVRSRLDKAIIATASVLAAAREAGPLPAELADVLDRLAAGRDSTGGGRLPQRA